MGWWATADPRALGLFRIALGTLLTVEVARRWVFAQTFYTGDGLLPNALLLEHPPSGYLFSPHLAFATPASVNGLFAFHLAVSLAFLLGWRTRLMHILSAALLVSMNSRAIIMENGGWVVLIHATLWTVFLPLGRRYGVDAWRESYRRRAKDAEDLDALADQGPDKRPVAHLAVLALWLQWVVIYWFNVVNKGGGAWRDGTALHYFLEQDRIVTAFGGWLSTHMPHWMTIGGSWGALLVEALIALALISPWNRRVLRPAALLGAIGLHGTIAATAWLGPFSYAMMVGFIPLIPKASFDDLEAIWARCRPPKRLGLPAGDGVALAFGRLVRRLDPTGRVRFTPAETLALARPGTEEAVSGPALFPALGRQLAPGPLGALLGVILRWFHGYCAADPEARTAPGVEPPPAGPMARRWAAVLALASNLVLIPVVVAGTSQVLVENGAVPGVLKPKHRPRWMIATIVYPRMYQGWSMFAPGPPMVDGRLVIDARTRSGEKIDPLTGGEPSFDINPPTGYGFHQGLGNYMERLTQPRHRTYVHALRRYLQNWHRRTGKRDDELIAAEVWWVFEKIPPEGEPPETPARRRLLGYGALADPLPFEGRTERAR